MKGGKLLLVMRLQLLALLYFLQEESMTANEIELKSLKESLQDTQPVGAIVNCCRTLDQVIWLNNQLK